ncbi:MAG: lipoate--protein ligase family protein [Cyclobacteriaceae bacterium]|nr:lipoate--protein ligase family protein [Cyclobacteriaceae bacterium]
MKWRLVDAGEVNYLRSQGIYHGLGHAMSGNTPNTVVLCDPVGAYMCAGFFQDPRHELDLEYCKAAGLPVIRRETGGGTVYIDHNQLFVQWIFQPGILPPRVDQRFQWFIKPLVETYKFFGIDAYYHPVNDVHVAGKKIVGTGAATIGNADVVTGNFIFDFDFDKMTRALNVPDEYFRQWIKEGLDGFLTSIKKENGAVCREELRAVYIEKCEEVLGVKLIPSNFTDREIAKMEEIEARFGEDDWLFGHTKPKVNDRLVKIHAGVWIGSMEYEWEGSKVRVVTRLEDNIISKMAISGQFENPIVPQIDNLGDAMKGVKIEEKAVLERLTFFFQNHRSDQKDEWIAHLSQAILKVKKEKNKMTGDG